MPKIIQTAIYVTKRLDFRYLWIDRLCIVQDNREDWEAQAKQMARIYENAVLTLAAIGSKTAQKAFIVRAGKSVQTHQLKQYTAELK
jgi:hypothetical protein